MYSPAAPRTTLTDRPKALACTYMLGDVYMIYIYIYSYVYMYIHTHVLTSSTKDNTNGQTQGTSLHTHKLGDVYMIRTYEIYIYIYKYSYIHIYILTYVLTSSAKDNTNGQTQGTSLHTHAWWRVMNRVLKGSHYCHEKKRPATWFIHMSDVTRLYVWAKSWNIVIMVTQKKSMWHEHVIHMDNMTHSRVTWLIYMCHEPILEMQPLWSQKKERRVIWLTHMRAVLIHMCVMDRLEALTWVSYSFIWMT